MDKSLVVEVTLGQTAIVRILLDHGLSPNGEAFGYTPLYGAAKQGNPELVELLLKAGAKPNHACQADVTPLMIAANSGSTATVKLLLDAHADATRRTITGATVTHFAAGSGNAEMLTYLLDHGAPFMASTRSGVTPLTDALREDNAQTALVMLARGAKLDPKGSHFEDELEAVLRLDLAEFIEPLVLAGWPADSSMDSIWSVGQAAIIFKATRCVEVLDKHSLLKVKPFVGMGTQKSISARPTLRSAISLEDPRPEEAALTPGEVEVEFIIDAQGKVLFPRLIKADDARLRKPTLEVIRGFKYRPAYVGSEPTALQVKQILVWQRTDKKIFDVQDLDRPPVIKNAIAPMYPTAAKRANATGSVKIEYIVDTLGRATNFNIISSPHEVFSNSVINALSKWTFYPSERHGVPVNTHVMQDFPFNLD